MMSQIQSYDNVQNWLSRLYYIDKNYIIVKTLNFSQSKCFE